MVTMLKFGFDSVQSNPTHSWETSSPISKRKSEWITSDHCDAAQDIASLRSSMSKLVSGGWVGRMMTVLFAQNREGPIKPERLHANDTFGLYFWIGFALSKIGVPIEELSRVMVTNDSSPVFNLSPIESAKWRFARPFIVEKNNLLSFWYLGQEVSLFMVAS